MADFVGLGVAEIVLLLRERRASVSEVVEEHLRFAARVDESISSFSLFLSERAVARAAELDRISRAEAQLPLYGVPIAVKDIFDIAGTPSTMGSRLFASEAAKSDSHVVERLEMAGAVILGKLSMDEFALGVTGATPVADRAKNPWDIERITGGSSSGSGAAVAGLQCVASVGTDTGGSVRVPSALCGITGIKPTFGRITRHGVVPLSWSLDHVGPMARSAADALQLLAVLTGHDAADPFSTRAGRPRTYEPLNSAVVGVALDGVFGGADQEVVIAVREAARVFAECGAKIEEIVVNLTIPGGIITTEAAATHKRQLVAHPELIGHEVREMLERGLHRPVDEYALAKEQQAVVRNAFRELFERFDLLITPTTPSVAPSSAADARDTARRMTRFTGLLNQAGVPAVSIPCGFSASGLPIGLQIVAPPWHDEQALRAAGAFQEATEFHKRVPPAAEVCL
jgi:aspartyl-tRNA(Asn)/glutamyl-tRNA(Gln) amidotransferase subunit A